MATPAFAAAAAAAAVSRAGCGTLGTSLLGRGNSGSLGRSGAGGGGGGAGGLGLGGCAALGGSADFSLRGSADFSLRDGLADCHRGISDRGAGYSLILCESWLISDSGGGCLDGTRGCLFGFLCFCLGGCAGSLDGVGVLHPSPSSLVLASSMASTTFVIDIADSC